MNLEIKYHPEDQLASGNTVKESIETVIDLLKQIGCEITITEERNEPDN